MCKYGDFYLHMEIAEKYGVVNVLPLSPYDVSRIEGFNPENPNEVKFVLEGVKKVYSGFENVCIFQPHRISRLKDLRKEFSFAFQNADTVVLCPVYTAGEKIKLGFSYLNFAKEIIKNSKVDLIMINSEKELAKFAKQNIYGNNIVIGMGAGSISNWIRNLPKLIKWN